MSFSKTLSSQYSRAVSTRSGYTITELAVVLMVVSVLLSLTLPAVIPLMRGNRLRGAASILSASLRATRVYAMNTRQVQSLVVIQFTPAEMQNPPLDFTHVGYNTGQPTTIVAPNAYLETRRGDGTILPSPLPDLIYVDTVRTANVSISQNAMAQATDSNGNIQATDSASPANILPVGWNLVTFRGDGSLDTTGWANAAARYRSLWLVDFRSVQNGVTSWNSATVAERTDGPGGDSKQAWRRSVLRLDRLTGRVTTIDPDAQPDLEDELMP